MRWCIALSFVVVALVALTVKAGRRAPRKTAAATPEIADLVEPTQSDAPPPQLAAATAEPQEASGIAHVRGRIVFPAGSEPPDDVEVVAESGTRTFDAEVSDDGRFQIHLPPGRYTLAASAGPLVGTAPDVLLRGGAEREVDIRLAVGAAIRGRLRLAAVGLEPEGVAITAVVEGREEDSGVSSIKGDSFAIEGLLPGRRYELRFAGPYVRTVTMSGLTAPADGLFVDLQPRAEIEGAIGFERGALCPIDEVKLLIDGNESDDDDASARVGRDCAFTLKVPDQATAVTVVATGKGWFLEQRVAIPAQGNPGPICLNPSCRTDPDQGVARLRLTLDEAPQGSSIDVTLRPTGKTQESSTYHSCHGDEGMCDIKGLYAGETFVIGTYGDDCHGDPVPITVVAGDNFVRIPCHRQRRIEGVIRIPEDQQPDAVIVRCAGGDWHPMTGTRLFELTCDAAIRALEYRIGSQGALRSVPIASLAGSDPAFVDIGN
jgi:hypothetical protein